MRLQLLIQRHSLPVVAIIHTTGTGPSSHTKSRFATVFDLLSDVNDLVTLESSDGEWGLDDYVVEVAATGDQQLSYECLHFQTLESVLREDDEVVVRAMSSEDLRVRRLGGRHQIAGDGRHLVDGVPFGKQWLRKTTRPGIVIPPRKKRRLLVEEDNGPDDSDEALKAKLTAILREEIFREDDQDDTRALVPFMDDDDEDEDDDNYEDNDEVDDHEPENQTTVSRDFDDADADSDDYSEMEAEVASLEVERVLVEAAEINQIEQAEGLSSELQQLLEDAAEVETPEKLSLEVRQLLEDAADIEQASNLTIASRVLRSQLKRKRTLEDEGEHNQEQEQEEDNFNGFDSGPAEYPLSSQPAVTSLTNGVLERESDEEFDEEDGPDSLLDEISAQQEEKRIQNIVEDDEDDSNDSDAASGSGTSPSDVDADSLIDGIAMEQARKRTLNLIKDSEPAVDDDETSSSGSDTDDDDEVSDTTSSSGSDSDSDNTSELETSSSSESEVESEAESAKETEKPTKKAMASAAAPSTSAQLQGKSVNKPAKDFVGIPFEGTRITRRNNDRAKRRARLNALKQQGLLPPNADFKALDQYDEAPESHIAEPEVEQVPAKDQAAADLIGEDISMENEGLKVTVEQSVIEVNKENIKPPGDEAPLSMIEPMPEPVSAAPEIPETSQLDSQTAMEPSPKRARLDIASGRRMILGSLGLRVPKTAEDTQKLRDKVSQNVRQLKQRREGLTASGPQPPQIITDQDPDAWKTKLIVSAVECEEPGGILPPPPFPFQQGWAKPHQNKRKMRDQNQYYQGRNDRYQEEADRTLTSDVTTLNYDDDAAHTHEAEESTKEDDEARKLPTDEELEKLPTLEQAGLRPGATIAYQELHVDASTNYEPAISPYRVGEISVIDDDGTVHLQLAKGLYGLQSQAQIDDETGARTYSKFEIADDDEDDDDGTRDVSFSNMIKPRLVKPSDKSSSVQVPESSSISLRGGEAPTSSVEDDVAVVPESAEQAIETQLNLEIQASIDDSQTTEKPAIALESINTPRKLEINGMIKEAGFDSALDEQLLQPIAVPADSDVEDDDAQDDATPTQGRYAHRFRRRSPRVIITSSDPQPSSAVEAELTFNDDPTDIDPAGGSSIPAISSPYMPTLTTVDYPHISQMDLASSAPVRTANSSSHQDAQKLSPALAVDLSFTVSEPDKSTEQEVAIDNLGSGAVRDVIEVQRWKPSPTLLALDNPVHDPLESSQDAEPEIEQSQFPQVTSDLTSSPPLPPDNEGSSLPQTQNSFLDGLGFDGGNDSSYHDSALDEDSDLPSLSELTSAARSGRRTSTRRIRKSPSPEPARKSIRSSNASALRSNGTKRMRKSPTPLSSPELPPSSQPEFKQSQSQREPRLSQIPAGSQVVDLTLSSDPLSPMKRPIAEKDDDSDYVVSRKRKGKPETVTTTRTTASRRTKQASQESGIGKRTLLTKKRDSDPKYY